MSDNQAPTREPKRGQGWRPRYGRAPALGALGLLCLYGVIHAIRIPENSDRPHVTVLLGASIQLLSGTIYVATRRRWSPLFNLRELPVHTPWATYGLALGPLFIWLPVALWWMLGDLRPHISVMLLRASAIPSLAQACVVWLAERSFRRHALQLLLAPALPPDLRGGARGTVTGTVEAGARSVVLHRLYRTWLVAEQGVVTRTGESPRGSITEEATAAESAALPITITTPGGPLLLERAPNHWATDQVATLRPKLFALDVHAEVCVGDRVLVLGNVHRESPGAEPTLTGDSSAPLVVFGAPRGTNPRFSLWWLYLRSWLRVIALVAFAGCALAAARWNPMVDRYQGTIRVTTAIGVEGLKEGDTCGISLLTYISRLGKRRCQATLTCAGRDFYGIGNDGFFDCEITPLLELGRPQVKGADLLITRVDDDPAFSIDSAEGSVRYWDKGDRAIENTIDIQGTLVTLEAQ